MTASPRRAHASPPRVAILLGVLVAALVACGGPTATRGGGLVAAPSSAGGSSPGAGIDVAGAEALVFQNRYADADNAYRTLAAAHPDDPVTHASWALFLNYRQQGDAAAAEARRAVAAAPTSARAHAVQCRVYDWANHLDDAVREGRRAVSLDRSDPFGHLFLSEALADHGDLPGARAELATAAAQIGPTSAEYLRAELHREEGNLGHDAGDMHAELVGYQAAFQVQPNWVERPSELASAYLDSGDLTGAHNAVGAAVALTPRDSDLLASLGRIGMFQQDYATAADAYAKLAALRPSDSVSQYLDAHAHYAATHDLDGTVALLQRAITLDPSDVGAVAYLEMLEANVREDAARGVREVADAVAAAHDDLAPRAGTVTAPPDLTALRAARAGAALTTLNTARTAAGLPAVVLDPSLTASALDHCYYWLFNNASPTVAKLGIHSETAGLPGFSGVRPGDRAVNLGWHQGPVGEDITHAGDPVLAVGQWVDSVYHRFPMMRPDLSAIGYADCSAGPLPMEDMEFGFGIVETTRHEPTPYPGPGQVKVPAVFVDNELPDPVPDGKPRTTGYPITVTFDPYARVSGATLTLRGPDGRALDGYAIAPDRADGNAITLLPIAPLAAATRYTGHVTATVDGVAYDRTWSFTTG